MKTVTTLVNARKHDSAVRQHHATGVVLLSSAGERLFMNHEAQNYILQLQPFTKENGTCLISEDVRAVVSELITQLMQCDHPKDCETIGGERICFGLEQQLLLRDSACRTNRRAEQPAADHHRKTQSKTRMPRRQDPRTVSSYRARTNGHHLSDAWVHQ